MPRDLPPFRADHVGSLLRPPQLLQARADHADGPDRRRRAARGRGRRRSATWCGCRRTSVCRPAPTASSAVPRGTWTSSTSWTACSRTDEKIEVHFRNADGDLDFTSAALSVDEQGRPRRHRSSATTSSSCSRSPRTGDAEADHPVAEHGALPRRSGRDRPVGVPRRGRVLDRPVRGVRRAGPADRRARLHLPPARRHQPRLPQRPGAARRAGSSRAATPSTSTSATSARSTPPSPTGPDGLRVTTHMCRGNYRSSWAAEGGYDFVAEALFGELDVDGFFLEYDDERSGGFEPLRFVPAGQAGRARAGHHEATASWSRRTTSSGASTRRRSTSRSSSSACRPQCGFSSTVEGNDAHHRRGDRQARA